jgi:hypothetical protein
MFEEWRKKFHQREYQKGQESVAQDLAAQDFADKQELIRDAMKAAEETINLANEMAKDGDPHKRQLAAFIKDSAVGAAGHVVGSPAPDGGRDAIEATPFSETRSSGTSESSATTLPSSSPTNALPNGEPVKRGPGRPRKDGQPPKRNNRD